MLSDFPNGSNFFVFPRLKTVILILLLFSHFPSVYGQESNNSANDSPCKAARLASGQDDFKSAARFIKQCVESGSKTNVLAHVEDLLLGAEIEYYLGKNLQAANYASLFTI